jgi:hypothetical protein
MNRGCLLSWLPGARRPAITAKLTLPPLNGTRYDPEDRAVMAVAWRSAERCLGLLETTPEAVRRSLGDEVLALWDRADALAVALKRGRELLRSASPEALARRAAEAEVRALSATDSAEAMAAEAALRRARASASRADRARTEVVLLREAIDSLASDLDAFEARLTGSGLDDAAPGLIEGARRQRARASDALSAWEAVIAEVERDGA